ncbi:chch domain protein, partial [Cystoisospora suis]
MTAGSSSLVGKTSAPPPLNGVSSCSQLLVDSSVPPGRVTSSLLDPELIHERTGRRVEYFEAKVATQYEKKEREAIRKIVGREIREKCRPELDDYYDCMCDRTVTFLACRGYAAAVQKCVKKYENSATLPDRWQEIAREREALGLSLVKRQQRKIYNKYISDMDGAGWLPKRK